MFYLLRSNIFDSVRCPPPPFCSALLPSLLAQVARSSCPVRQATELGPVRRRRVARVGLASPGLRVPEPRRDYAVFPSTKKKKGKMHFLSSPPLPWSSSELQFTKTFNPGF